MSLYFNKCLGDGVHISKQPPASTSSLWVDISGSSPSIKIFDRERKQWIRISTGGGNGGSGLEIDDNSIVTDRTWSSFKINNELSTKTEIDDSLEESDSKTFSINKILSLMESHTKEIIIQPNSPVEVENESLWIKSGVKPLEFYVYLDNEWQQIGSGEIDEISANIIRETFEKQLISADKKAQIDANASDVQSALERISLLEENGVIGESDGRVKLNEEDTMGFLEEKIDNDTIKLINNKLSVGLLADLEATIEEINQLQGVSGNVQAQIDALSNIGNFTHSVTSHEDLLSIEDMQPKDMVIVLSDETQEDKSTIYIYTGSSWQFSGEFKGGEIRDFKEKPLDINAETKGMLQKGRYEPPESQEVSYSDPNGQMKSKNVRDALSELFQLANSFKQGVVSTIGSPLQNNDTREELLSKIQQIKTTLASNLMGKGVIAYPYNTLNEMVNKVKSIPNVIIGGNLKKITKLNIEAPYEQTITLEQPLKIEDVAVSVLEYVGDEVGVTHYEAEYNNGESENFDYDKRFIQFDGHMKLKENHKYELTSIEQVEEDYELLESEEINLNDYADFGNLSVDNDVTLTALPHTQIIKASGDIVIAGVESIEKMELINESKGNGQALLAISFDSGASYQAYKQGKWIVVNVNSVTDFLQKGMNKDEVNKLSDEHLKELRGESNYMRFAYLLSRDAFSDVAYNDKLKIVVTMQGYNVIADTKKYNYSYDAGSRTFTFNFNESGTYTFNYVDGE